MMNVFTYVPTVLQERVLVELREAPSLSPPGVEPGFDLAFDLGLRLPRHRPTSLGVLDRRRPGGQIARLSLLWARTGWDLAVEKWRRKAGKLEP